MDWDLLKPWVNRVGIVLEFLSFWLAAPEILGEERLRALERRVEEGIKELPWMVVSLMGFAGVWIVVAILNLVNGAWFVQVLIFVLMLLVFGLAVIVVQIILEEEALPPLLQRLADDKRIRQRSLAVGAVLFMVGFVLQLIATV